MTVSFTAFSQNLTLPDLIALQGKSLEEIRKYFTDAEWKFVDERFSDKRGFGDMAFTSTETPVENTMFVKIYYGLQKASQTRIQLNLKNKDQFTAIKSGLASSDLKFVSTETAANLTTTVFKSDNIVVRIVATRPVGASVAYEIHIESTAYDPKMYNFSLGK
jgi:hypothetical protein